MSSTGLSQNEIDLLFNGGASPGESSAPRASGQEVQVYDFKRPARISKDRKRSLSGMYGLLTKSIESWLTGRVRDTVEVNLLSVEQITFGEFMLALPSPCTSFILELTAVGSQGVIDFGREFAYFLVDRLLGGASDSVALPERALTPIERLVVRIAAERVANQLNDVWKDHVKLGAEISGFESIPEMIQVANREDPVLVGHVDVKVAGLNATLMLCIPFTPVETFFTGGTSRRSATVHGTPQERQHDQVHMEATLRSARLAVGARLPAFEMPLGSLLALRPGSVVTTGISNGAGVELLVAGQCRFRGIPGRVGEKLAVQVIEAVTPEPTDTIHPGREPWS
jgi:flagellar motor switch protein FliM